MAEVSPSTQRDIQSSTDYAKNQLLLDPLLKREEDLHLSTHARAVSFSTLLESSEEPQFLRYFSFSLPRTLAFFLAPEGFATHTSRIFSYQIIPAFGPPEALAEKRKRLKRRKRKKKGSVKEKDALEKMLDCLADLEEDLALFMGFRDHFQKG